MKKKIIVKQILEDGTIIPYFLDGKYIESPIKVSQVKLLKKNYLQELEAKTKKNKDEKKILEDIETIDEMLSKVNEKDFRKIYAGSILAIPNELKGIALLLNQWAFNKRHLYKMMGNNLSISKELEYTKDESSIRQDREELYRAFPGASYVINNLHDIELLTNKLEHTETGAWTEWGRMYKPGEKVSKLLDEAFHNDKLNIMYSDIIAQNKIKGVLEISIDPIDILLMSCNVSGWNSCHNIHRIGTTGTSYGCYSAGIFSYMCDDVSMIAFRHDNKLYDFKINNQKVQAKSKNWRQMVWIDKDFKEFVTSRQYPNKLEEVTKTVREMLEEQVDAYTKDATTWTHSDSMDKIREIMKDDTKEGNALHYNDMLKGFNGDLCYRKGLKLTENSIIVGSHPICPRCGKNIMLSQGTPECFDCYRRI